MVLEARSQKLRCQQGHVLSEGSWGGILPCLFQLLVVAGHPCYSLACRCITPVSAFVFTWPLPLCGCVSVSRFLSSYKDMSYIGFQAHSNPVYCYLKLDYICKETSKVTFIGTGRYDLEKSIGENTIQSCNNMIYFSIYLGL